MNPFTSHPVLRWAVPGVAAVAVVGGTTMSGLVSASAGSDLPPRTAAQLLVDVQGARLDAISGTVVQRAELGLPDISSLTGGSPGGPGGASGSGSSSFGSMISGTHTVRLWYSGPDKARVALMGSLGESDLVRNGRDVWSWSSQDNTATHTTLPAGTGMHAMPGRPGAKGLMGHSPAGAMPGTPQEAADQALAAIGKSTIVTTNRSASVAGRSAYELVLAPKDTSSLVGQVRIAIDGVKHVPLRVQVFAKGTPPGASPAFEVAFSRVDFGRPDAAQFRFTPPPGAKVTQQKLPSDKRHGPPSKAQLKHATAAHQKSGEDRPRVIGTGWTSILVAEAPKAGAPSANPGKSPNQAPSKGMFAKPGHKAGQGPQGADQLTAMLAMLPKVSGSWGSGHLLAGKLFSVLVTDDGRVLAGAVTPSALYAAAAK